MSSKVSIQKLIETYNVKNILHKNNVRIVDCVIPAVGPFVLHVLEINEDQSVKMNEVKFENEDNLRNYIKYFTPTKK